MLNPDISQLSDLIGIVGVVMILLAYFFCQIGKLSITSWTYLLADLFGSGFIFYSLMYHLNLSAFCVEIAWMLISLMGIGKLMLRAKRNRELADKSVVASEAKQSRVNQ